MVGGGGGGVPALATSRATVSLVADRWKRMARTHEKIKLSPVLSKKKEKFKFQILRRRSKEEGTDETRVSDRRAPAGDRSVWSVTSEEWQLLSQSVDGGSVRYTRKH